MAVEVPWGAAIIAGRVGIGADGFARYAVTNARGCRRGEMRAKKLRLPRGARAEARHWLEATGVSVGPNPNPNPNPKPKPNSNPNPDPNPNLTLTLTLT